MFKTIKRLVFGTYKPTTQEAQFIQIVEELIAHPKTVVKMSPLTMKYYITNESKRYYVMVREGGIYITNSKFTLVKTLHNKAHDMVMAVIHAHMEEDRQQFEDKIFKKETEILNSVLTNISK